MAFNLKSKCNNFSSQTLKVMAIVAGLALTSVAPVAGESNQTIEVAVDHAKVMRISEPAATVIIGNPGIADATVQDDKTLVITGKSFGITNIIVMNDSGTVLADALLTVRGERVNAVTVYRRTERETYSCSPNCERSLALGDASETFGRVQNQIQQRNSVASGGSGS